MATADMGDSPFTPRDFADEKAPDTTKSVMGSGKPFPPGLPNAEAYVVEFDGSDDAWLPYNWPSGKKCACL
jgi:hypothetical protein